MSQFREASVYIHRKTLRRLWWCAKAKGMVPAALADQIINEALERDYPQIKDAEAAVKQAEAEFAKSMGKTVEELNLDS